MRRLAFAVVLMVAASACSGGGGHRGDASTDAIIDLSSLAFPDGCPSGVANEKGVGEPCTRGGNQCRSPLLCTCDPVVGALLTGVPCFCTLAAFAQNGSKDPCKDSVPDPANYCGSGATCCNVLNSGAYCSPNICLINGGCIVFVPADGGT